MADFFSWVPFWPAALWKHKHADKQANKLRHAIFAWKQELNLLLKLKYFPFTQRWSHPEDLSLHMTLLTPVWTIISVRPKLLLHELKRCIYLCSRDLTGSAPLVLLFGCQCDRADLHEHHVGVCVWAHSGVLCERLVMVYLLLQERRRMPLLIYYFDPKVCKIFFKARITV